MLGHPEIMGAEESTAYLRTRIGDCAPMAETLRQWSGVAYRRRYAAVVAERRIPKGVTVPGTKKLAFSKDALDAFADTMIAQVKAGEAVPEPDGKPGEAPA